MEICSSASGFQYVGELLKFNKIVVLQSKEYCHIYFRTMDTKQVLPKLYEIFGKENVEEYDVNRTLSCYSVLGVVEMVVPSIQTGFEE